MVFVTDMVNGVSIGLRLYLNLDQMNGSDCMIIVGSLISGVLKNFHSYV